MTSILDPVAAEAASHWAALADSEERMAGWYEDHGLPFGDVSSFRFRAKTYRRTAEALRRESVTGKPHCSACGGDHSNHHHPSVASNAGCGCKGPACPWCTP